jgi:hypothetical protein
MARLPSIRRGAGEPDKPRPAPRPAPPSGVVRRRRRALLRVREAKLRDLGGLMLEMYRRDRFREDLLAERCEELQAIDASLDELEAMLDARRRAPGGRCDCGAPLPWGSHFCPNCGRPAGETVLACEACGHPIPADGRFCAACGTPAADGDADEAPEPAAVADDAREE